MVTAYRIEPLSSTEQHHTIQDGTQTWAENDWHLLAVHLEESSRRQRRRFNTKEPPSPLYGFEDSGAFPGDSDEEPSTTQEHSSPESAQDQSVLSELRRMVAGAPLTDRYRATPGHSSLRVFPPMLQRTAAENESVCVGNGRLPPCESEGVSKIVEPIWEDPEALAEAGQQKILQYLLHAMPESLKLKHDVNAHTVEQWREWSPELVNDAYQDLVMYSKLGPQEVLSSCIYLLACKI